ncbi:photosystem I reaction center subunit PsaK [Leptolyngbya sp. FACHB-60]|uniref:photosystem I reaction center subunit PsaK n=1 Tax=unclassified Leptolyngbya TaxID=2650499 RepID=UPI001683EFFF|nr:photosystem I reaction center subunit PsaK [Leptolyngbya sp. FACHB-60]MBD1916848.1 photosystem I reaction center subunit PsaK [Phormidium sp. FACHB-77]MBD2029479.1 photosystem I reaction center subunit PsaK [Phormidium sp. FACHB-322]MBD2052055.1 photosystem I reaction center subunit PsaK [Leptolyngbya sp. FACHB-60]
MEAGTLAFLPILAAVPHTPDWSPKVAVVMILCNILAIVIGRLRIKYPSAPPAMPGGALFGNLGLPAVLASASFGHLIGTGVILGLANLGVL